MWFRFVCCTDVGYIETSALTGMNVEECFIKLARAVIETIDNGARRTLLLLTLFFLLSRVMLVAFCDFDWQIAENIFFHSFSLIYNVCETWQYTLR